MTPNPGPCWRHCRIITLWALDIEKRESHLGRIETFPPVQIVSLCAGKSKVFWQRSKAFVFFNTLRTRVRHRWGRARAGKEERGALPTFIAERTFFLKITVNDCLGAQKQPLVCYQNSGNDKEGMLRNRWIDDEVKAIAYLALPTSLASDP